MKYQTGEPLHKLISDWIQEKITNGEFHANQKLPSENDLSEQFSVSRVTVRRALQTLESDNTIYRCQGLGSFVSEGRAHQTMTNLTDFYEDMVRIGVTPGTRLISKTPEECPEGIHSYLHLKESAVVLCLHRVRLGNDQPIAYDITWIPLFYGQLLENFDLEQRTIYDILENEYDIPILKGCFRMEAANASEEIASHLQIPSGAAVLQMDRISYTIADKPVYIQRRYIRSDRMVFEVRADREHTGKPNQNEQIIRGFNAIVSV